MNKLPIRMNERMDLLLVVRDFYWEKAQRNTHCFRLEFAHIQRAHNAHATKLRMLQLIKQTSNQPVT